MKKDKKTFITRTAHETIRLGKRLAHILGAGDIVYLSGELGSGKTTFTKGICQGLGIKENVTSPSFVIASQYNGKIPVCHIDLYRLCNNDFDTFLIEEYYISEGVTIIEWADRLPHFFKKDKHGIYIFFEIKKNGKRRIEIEDLRH